MENNNTFRLVQTNHSHVYYVLATVPGQQPKMIAKLDTTGQGRLIIIRNEKHLFTAINGLGINYFLLAEKAIPFKWIIIDYCGKKYVSTREYYLKKGHVMQFKQQGFELQIIVPLSELTIKAVEEFEKGSRPDPERGAQVCQY